MRRIAGWKRLYLDGEVHEEARFDGLPGETLKKMHETFQIKSGWKKHIITVEYEFDEHLVPWEKEDK
jgi:hypothetical protein